MNILEMKGSWGRFDAKMYNLLVSPALQKIYDRMIDRFVPGGAITPGMRLLDVGCGRGYLAIVLGRRYPEARFVGVDLSQEMVDRARESAAGLPNVSFKTADAQALPFEADSFDVVLSMASIKHWPDRLQGLREIFRVLRPGGEFFLMEVHRYTSRQAMLDFVRNWRFVPWPLPYVVAEYFRRFVVGSGLTIAELESLCGQAGLQTKTVETLQQYPAVIASGSKPMPAAPAPSAKRRQRGKRD